MSVQTYIHGEIMAYAEAFNDGINCKLYSVYEEMTGLKEAITHHVDTTGNIPSILYAKLRGYENSLKYRDDPRSFDLEPVVLEEKDKRPLPEKWVWITEFTDARRNIMVNEKIHELRAYVRKGKWEISWCGSPIHGENMTRLIFGSVEDAIKEVEAAHTRLMRS